MSLTYQPFAETPQLEELRHDLEMNVPDNERMISTAGGTGLLAAALAGRGLSKWILFFLGSALIYRGISGQCPVYRQLELDQRHHPRGLAGKRA